MMMKEDHGYGGESNKSLLRYGLMAFAPLPALPADYKKLTIDVTERLANSGWTLQSKGIQIVKGRYDCSLC